MIDIENTDTEERNDTATSISFENAFSKLEKILAQLGQSETPLDTSLSLYEEACQLIQICDTKLAESEKKIEILAKKRDGSLELNSSGEAVLTHPYN